MTKRDDKEPGETREPTTLLETATGRAGLVDGEDLLGRRIRNVVLVRRLGRGGMGEVFEGYDEVLQRPVAVKAIRAEQRLDSERRRRFIREARILSALDHPNICKAYEFIEEGSTDLLVLEFVDGVTLTDETSAALELREKLKVARQVARALAAAHLRGVIHRDLKPSNVMISRDRVVKILDFGLARASAEPGETGSSDSSSGKSGRALRPEDPDITVPITHPDLTQQGQAFGTPSYMSPEQARGEPLGPASDIYSLGLVLQELFSGRPPYEAKTTTEILSLAQEGRSLPATGLRKDIAALIRRLKSSRPEDRPTAAETLQSLQHILDRPKRLLRYLGTAAAIVLLALGPIKYTIDLRRERDRANEEAETAQQVSRFLVDLFRISDPSEARGSTVTAREILDRGALEIQQALAGQPLVQARLMGTIGSVYRGLGLYVEAEPLLERSADLLAERLGPGHPDTLDARGALTDLYILQGRLEEAERVALEVLQACRTMLGADDELTLAAVNNLAGIYQEQGRYDEAEPLFVESLVISRRLRGADHPDTLRLMNNLAGVYEDLGRHEDSTPLYRETLAGRRRALGEDHPETLTSVNNLAWSLLAQKRYAEAEVLLREAAASFERVLGAEHPQTQVVRSNLGELLLQTGRYEEAEPLLASVLKSVRESLPPAHWFPAVAQRRWGQALSGLGRYEEAEVQLLQAVDRLRASFDPGHERVVRAEQALAELYDAWGRKEETARYTSPE